MKTVVLDTNVLLNDPKVIMSFPDAEVAIPEVVLGELDRIKVSRTDADVRFRGREVSRIIFELSEGGSLTDGVKLPDGGTLRIIPFANASLPDGMSTRNVDDKILACAWQLNQVKKSPKDEVVLVTNDLNMLLKAQTLGIKFEQWDDGIADGWGKKYVIRPFQRYKVPITILALSLAVFAGVFFYARSLGGGGGGLPPEYKSILSQGQITALEAMQGLQKDPQNGELLLTLANFYYDQYQNAVTAAHNGASVDGVAIAKKGIEYYEKYLKNTPNDPEALVDMAFLQFSTGYTDQAIQNVTKAISISPNHPEANYNLGFFYLRGRQDFDKARAQFERVIDITKNDTAKQDIKGAAQNMITQIEEQQKSIENGTGTTPDAGTVPKAGGN